MHTTTLRRRTAAAVLAASCVLGPAVAMVAPASAADASAVPSAAPVNTTPPSLVFENNRGAAVGDATNVNPGTWETDGPLSFSYQWQLDGVTVATGETYTPVVADIGKSLTVIVTTSNGTESSAPATSDASTVDKGDITYLTTPDVTGTYTVGSTLTLDPGTWDVATATPEYLWYLDNEQITGAASATYTIKAADLGLPISAGVILREPNYYPAMAFTNGFTVHEGTLTNLTAPAVTGTPVVGSTLTVVSGTWSSTDEVILRHQWTVGGTPVAGATRSTFVVPASAAGKSIAVVESAVGSAWAPASADSTAVTAKKAPAKVVLKLASPAKGKLKATVVVTSAVATTGKIVVKIGKVTRTLTLKNGKATVTLAKLKKGVTKVTASYAGATGVSSAKDTGSVRVK